MSARLSAFLLQQRPIQFIAIGLSCLLISCFENPVRPTLVTNPIEVISANEIIVGGTLTSDGGSDIIEKGICVSTHQNTTISDGRMIIADGGNLFEILMNPVNEGTTSYYRAYAITGAGIGYGNEEVFSSIRVNIEYFGEVTGYTAFARGYSFSDQEIFSRGFCWSTSPNPTITNNKLEAGAGSGAFTGLITGLTPGTTYHTRAYAVGSSGVFYGESVTFTTKDFPKVTTKEFINASTFIVTTGGDVIITDLGYPLTVGVCWSTNPSPTIANDKTVFTFNSLSFNSEMAGLQPNTTYYIRAYATNIVGTAYGNERVMTTPAAAVYDADGNPYSSVSIGSQTWTVENLRTTKYSNGDNIINITNQVDWINASSGAWRYYENAAEFNHPYGKLYNWFAVSDARALCPSGWHAPSDSEWTTLINFLGGNNIAGSKLREIGTMHWALSNNGSTNSSGFTALPGGSTTTAMGYSYPLGILGLFWSNTPSDAQNAFGYSLFSYDTSINRLSFPKQSGHSVRCIKN